MKIFVSVILFAFLLSCSSSKKMEGLYASNCLLYSEPSLKLILNPDGVFFYERPFVEEEIKGIWIKEKDTIILKSEVFMRELLENREKMAPKLKYTNLENRDAFVLKGAKLYPINKDGVSKECFLQRLETEKPR